MRILVTGSKGQLGCEIINVLRAGFSEIAQIDKRYAGCDIVGVDVDELDITNFAAVSDFVLEQKPDIAINCAAMTNVDACETNEEVALRINAIGPRNLAMATRMAGSKLVHISTDYVFAGDAAEPYCEWDFCAPQTIYGKSKLLGENYVMTQNPKSFIVRTSWLYGANGNNFVKTMVKLGQEKTEVRVVNDQRGNPTNANDLAHHILKIALTNDFGIFHCTGNGECSWCEFAQKIMEFSGITCKVTPCTSEEFPRPAKRPAYSSLNNLMLKATVGDEMRDWKVALKSFCDNNFK